MYRILLLPTDSDCSTSPMKSSKIVPMWLATAHRPRLSTVQCASATLPRISLRTGLIGTRPGWSRLRESVKLEVRAHVHSRVTREWISYWNSKPLLTQLASAQPRVVKKIYRPYLNARLNCGQRLSVLTAHYDFIEERGLGALVLRAALQPVRLAQISGKSGTLYQLELVAIGKMEREGELVLQLVDGEEVIYSVAFTFITNGVSPLVAIGCLQGGRAEAARQQISGATRDLFGLRPKSLIVRLVQQIALTFGCDGVLLIGNDNRVMHQQIRKGRVLADYDGTWMELGAVPNDDGNFLLPCTVLAEPDVATIASNKRSAAKKRFALLVNTSREVCSSFQVHGSGSNRRV